MRRDELVSRRTNSFQCSLLLPVQEPRRMPLLPVGPDTQQTAPDWRLF